MPVKLPILTHLPPMPHLKQPHTGTADYTQESALRFSKNTSIHPQGHGQNEGLLTASLWHSAVSDLQAGLFPAPQALHASVGRLGDSAAGAKISSLKHVSSKK